MKSASPRTNNTDSAPRRTAQLASQGITEDIKNIDFSSTQFGDTEPTSFNSDSHPMVVNMDDVISGRITLPGIEVTAPKLIGWGPLGMSDAQSPSADPNVSGPKMSVKTGEIATESNHEGRAATVEDRDVSEAAMSPERWLDLLAAKFIGLEGFDPTSALAKVSSMREHLLHMRDEGHTVDQLVHLAELVNRGHFSAEDLLEWNSLYVPEPDVTESALPDISWLVHLGREMAQSDQMTLEDGLSVTHLVQRRALDVRRAGRSYSDIAPVVVQQTLTRRAAHS